MPKPEHMHVTQTHPPGSYVREHHKEVHQLMIDEEKFGKVRRTMKSKEEVTVRVNRVHAGIEVTLQDILDMIADEAPGIEPKDVNVTFSTMMWDSPATQQEIAEQEAHRLNQQARHEQWERDTVVKLLKKHPDLAS